MPAPAKKAAPKVTVKAEPAPVGATGDTMPGAEPSKADVKTRELFDEFEQLKADGNPDPKRLAELKKKLGDG